MADNSTRAGRYIRQPAGYRAFLPAPLPPDPPLVMDAELIKLLSDADRALGRLDGVASVLPNPELFVSTYVRHEPVMTKPTRMQVQVALNDDDGNALVELIRQAVGKSVTPPQHSNLCDQRLFASGGWS